MPRLTYGTQTIFILSPQILGYIHFFNEKKWVDLSYVMNYKKFYTSPHKNTEILYQTKMQSPLPVDCQYKTIQMFYSCGS